MAEQRSETVEKQRQRILNTTLKLIDSDGLESISARKIAAKMSCAVGSLYRNFDNLNAILLAVNIETLKALETYVRASIQSDDAKERIHQMGMAYMDYVLHYPRRWQLVMQDVAGNNPDDMNDYWVQQQTMFQMIEKAFWNLGTFQSKQAAYLEARTLWASLDGLCNLACRGKIEQEGEEGVKVFADILLERFLGEKS